MEREKQKINRSWMFVSILGFLSVLMGAFGAHGLKSILSEQSLVTFETAVRYQFYHTFALAVVLSLWGKSNVHYLKCAWSFFSLGIFLFSGSLYAYVFTQIHFFVFVTPIGGVCLLLGWLFLGLSHMSCIKTSR